MAFTGGTENMRVEEKAESMTASDNHHAFPGTFPRRFLLALVGWSLLYAGSLLLYNASYDWTRDGLIFQLQVRPSAWLLEQTLPERSIIPVIDSIQTPGLTLEIRRGCDGVEAWLLLVTALVLFPMPWRRRVRSLVWGTVLIFSLNILRIVSLFHIALFRPGWFEIAHGLVWQSGMVLAAALFVLTWLEEPAPRPMGSS